MPPLTALAAIRLALEKKGWREQRREREFDVKDAAANADFELFASICAHFVKKLLDTTQAVERRKVTEEEHLYHSREEKV